MNESGFLHMVYFYPKEGGTLEDATLLMEGCRRHLTNIPGIRRLEVGLPAGTPRPVVDNDYAVCLMVDFPNADAHDVYQVHPDHLRFIEECNSLWSRVQIFDTILIKD